MRIFFMRKNYQRNRLAMPCDYALGFAGLSSKNTIGKLRDLCQDRTQAAQGALFSQYRNNLVNPRADRGSSERYAHRLREFAHRQLELVQNLGESGLDGVFGKLLQRVQFF